MTKRIAKSLTLVMTGIFSLLVGLTHAAASEGKAFEPAACEQDSEAAFETMLSNSSMEVTPSYALERAVDYLTHCAGEPGSGAIARRAGRFALDAGDAGRAIELYEQARAYGARFSRADRLDLIAALVAEGHDGLAWSLRDDEVRRWLFELERTGFSEITETRLRDGMVYHVRFDAIDPALRQREAWLAVPYEAGWPVAVVRGADGARVSLRRLVAGRAAQSYEHLDLVRCHGRRTIIKADQGFAGVDLEAVATETAIAYLADPDTTMSAALGQPLPSCFDTHRLFVSPDPSTAVPAG